MTEVSNPPQSPPYSQSSPSSQTQSTGLLETNYQPRTLYSLNVRLTREGAIRLMWRFVECIKDYWKYKERSVKPLFRDLVNIYKRNQAPPPEGAMNEFNQYQGRFTWTDVSDWTDHYGIKGCVIFDEDTETIAFTEYPAKPHDQIADVIEVLFTARFRVPYLGQGGPESMWVGDGNTDCWFPGKKKQPDGAWRPKHRPQTGANAITAALIRMQPVLGTPIPTLILEVGSSQSITSLLDIRDRALGPTTQIKAVILISYNRNSTRPDDTFWCQLAVRDVFAPAPPPGTSNIYPTLIVLFDIPKRNNRYPRVEDPIDPQWIPVTVWSLPTQYLYYPEIPPNLNPALPPSFDFDITMIKQAIQDERRP